MQRSLSLPLVDWLALNRPLDGGGLPMLDAVVVGSGYGGSVAALRLAQQGYQVVVLERGAEFLAGDFPNDIGQLPKFLRASGKSGPIGSPAGLFDVHAGPGMASLVANGLGGGSLINAGVMMRPDADVFSQRFWPAEIRHGLDARPGPNGEDLGLDRAFATAERVLGGERFRDKAQDGGEVSRLPKAQSLKRLGAALRTRRDQLEANRSSSELNFDAKPATVTIDLDKCTRCGDCFSGCNVPGAKKTLTETYLQAAREEDVQLITRCSVYALAPGTDDSWTLTVFPTESGNYTLRLADAAVLHGTVLRARMVVIAAGTFGSTELLMRSREITGGAFSLSPALGTRLSGNGDSLTAVADLAEPADGVGRGAQAGQDPVGPTITTLLDLRDHPTLTKRLVVQEGAVPGALARVYQEILSTTWMFRHLGDSWRTPRAAPEGSDPLSATRELANHTLMLLTMGHDGSAGRIVWVPSMDGAAPYWVRPQDLETHDRQQRVFDAAESGTGGVHMHTPLWRLLAPELASLFADPNPEPTLLTVHPLGGCPMSDSFETGVVNHIGQVWKREHEVWANLSILDGSIVPTSLGCNPLWTITALAERAMAYQKASTAQRQAEGDWSPTYSPLPSRSPAPLERDQEPAFDMHVSERLEKEKLPLRGAMRLAMGVANVESDLHIQMRAADWTRTWDADAKHCLSTLSGRLRLLNAAVSPARKLEYEVVGGHVNLFGYEPPLPIVGALARLVRVGRVFITWLLLRGWRDTHGDQSWPVLAAWPTIARFAWQVAEVRHVRYDIRLRLGRAEGVNEPPKTLRLRGVKVISYAATWGEIACHLVRRVLQGYRHWKRPDRQRPGDLRASLLHQLTRPEIRIDDAASRFQWLPAWLSRSTIARFDFDEQEALQRSPARLYSGGDTSAALLAMLSYPALVGRFVLLTRLLEFRLPDYSGRPLIDAASPADVALRSRTRDGAPFSLIPDEMRLQVRRGRSSSDDDTEDPGNHELRLWRYGRIDATTGQAAPPDVQDGTWCDLKVRRFKSVLLMHAFDMSGYSFTFKETERNFAEHLYEEGWEVWILDSRMSPRTHASIEPCTVDQLGMIDAPSAIEHIIAALTAEHGKSIDAPPAQIFGFGQCMGAAALLIGLLGGKLSYEQTAGADFSGALGKRPFLPKLAGLVTSQVHPFIVGSRSAQSKTWVPPLLRDLAGRTFVPLGLRESVQSVVEAWTDRLFAALPVRAGERCHGEGEVHRTDDDDCVTCRRIKFFLGGMFSHHQLNWETHRALPKLFGAGSVRLFAQGAKFFEYERLCSEDGFNVYATDDAMSRYLALPIRFVHGELNDLFNCESATRSGEQYKRIHSHWVERFGLGQSRQRHVDDVIEGYSHVDVLIGKHAMCSADDAAPSVYGRLSGLLNLAWATPHAMPLSEAKHGTPSANLIVRFPKAGPFIGPIRDGGDQREVRVAFIIDDRTAEVPRGFREDAGALVWRAAKPSEVRFVKFERMNVPVPIPARDGFLPSSSPAASIGVSAAFRSILLPDDGSDGALHVRCFSYAYASAGPMVPPGARGALPLDDSRPMAGRVDLPASLRDLLEASPALVTNASLPAGLEMPKAFELLANHETPTVDELLVAVDATQSEADRWGAAADRPFPTTLSRIRRHPVDGSRSLAVVSARALSVLERDASVQVALGCCRYGGFPLDRDRADESLLRLLARVRQGSAVPDVFMMLGDQIYADRTAGLVDPLSPTERFLYRHQEAFTTDGLAGLIACLPTLCLPDDHEFIDSYPLGRPLFRGRADRQVAAKLREAIDRKIATQILKAYQMLTLQPEACTEGWCSFDRGDVRFFAIDTRLHRQRDAVTGKVTILHPKAADALKSWAEQGRHTAALHCLVSASVLLPGLVPGSDPANAGPPDSMQASEAERRAILELLVDCVPGRFVLVSGDYHISFAGEVKLDEQRVGAVVIAPPFYAPLTYANATPEDLWLDETIHLKQGDLTVRPVGSAKARRGSGFALLSFRKHDAKWLVEFVAELDEIDKGTGRVDCNWPSLTLGSPT